MFNLKEDENDLQLGTSDAKRESDKYRVVSKVGGGADLHQGLWEAFNKDKGSFSRPK